MLCVLDDIEFPIREYDIKGTQIKVNISFDMNQYPGISEQLELKCIPLIFEKYKDTILQLEIDSKIYRVKCKDCNFFRPDIHLNLKAYQQHLFNIYSKIMDDPSIIVEQHMKSFKNFKLDDENINEKVVIASGSIIFEKIGEKI